MNSLFTNGMGHKNILPMNLELHFVPSFDSFLLLFHFRFEKNGTKEDKKAVYAETDSIDLDDLYQKKGRVLQLH